MLVIPMPLQHNRIEWPFEHRWNKGKKCKCQEYFV